MQGNLYDQHTTVCVEIFWLPRSWIVVWPRFSCRKRGSPSTFYREQAAALELVTLGSIHTPFRIRGKSKWAHLPKMVGPRVSNNYPVGIQKPTLVKLLLSCVLSSDGVGPLAPSRIHDLAPFSRVARTAGTGVLRIHAAEITCYFQFATPILIILLMELHLGFSVHSSIRLFGAAALRGSDHTSTSKPSDWLSGPRMDTGIASW